MSQQPPSSAAPTASSPDAASVRHLLKDATLEIRRLRARVSELEQSQPQQPTPANDEPIAIVGMACRFPGGVKNSDDFWQLLENGVDAIVPIPAQRWDVESLYSADASQPGCMYVRTGGFIDDVDQFEPQFFGISPREAEAMDPQQRLLLEVSHEALENAGIASERLRGSATGVYVGICFDDYAQRNVRSGDAARIDAHSALGTNRSIAAGRIAYVMGLQGPVLQLDTTCSSSLVSVHLACQSLRNGEADLMLAGGVNLMLSPEATIGFCRLNALSADGRCRTFDADAQGYARGEGCGVLVLKRLRDAIADGDDILALVRASAVNHDGASNGLTAPNGPAQTAVIRAALAAGKLVPADVQYVEAHGTATPLGDPIEIAALADAYGERREPLVVGSVKTNFGHLESAAGVAGLIKSVLAIRHNRIPPHLHFATPSPRIAWQQLALKIPVTCESWPAHTGPRRAGISSFGMSGTNAHVIIEQAPEIPAPPANAMSQRPMHVLTLSARSQAALRELLKHYAEQLEDDAVNLADLCWSATVGRNHYACRRALVADNAATMREAIRAAIHEEMPAATRSTPRIAFLYTGQGSQYAGMSRALYETEPVFRAALERCAAVLDPLLSQPLLELLYSQADVQATQESALDLTINTQPALFALQYALSQLWRSWGVQPAIVLGHSVGEYAAAVQAGVMTLTQALRLLAARARLMHELPSGGAMLAVSASYADIVGFLPAGIELAVCNGASNIVLAGPVDAIERASVQLRAQKIANIRLAVSQAFHSALMEPMLGAFAAQAATTEFATPRCDFISSMSGSVANDTVDHADYWIEQIRRPVRFDHALDTLAQLDCDVCIELGPQPVLLAFAKAESGMAGKLLLPSLRTPVAAKSRDWKTLLQSLASLYEAGFDPDWRAFDAAYMRKRVALPNYPFQRRRYWQAIPAPGVSATTISATWPGRALPLAGARLRIFDTALQADDAVIWNDHRVLQAPLLPTAAYLCIALAAAETASAKGCRVESLTLARGLWLTQLPMALQTQLVAAGGDTGSWNFEMHCGDTLHASGRIVATEHRQQSAFDEMATAALQSLDTGDFYTRYRNKGIDYGTSFRCLDNIAVGSNVATANVRRVFAPLSGTELHPALIDAGLQLAGSLLADAQGAWLPRAVAAFEWRHDISAARVQARRVDATQDSARFDIRWFDDNGHFVGELQGLELARLDNTAAPASIAPEHAAPALHRIEWLPAALPQLQSPLHVQHSLRDYLNALADMPDVARNREAQPLLEALTVAYASAALLQLGWQPVFGGEHGIDAYTTAELALRLNVAPSQLSLFERVIAMAEAAQLLSAIEVNAERCWNAAGALPALQQSAAQCAGLEQRIAADHASVSAEFALLERCGSVLAGVLQGSVDALQVLFPAGDLSLLTALYETSPGARVMNALLREALDKATASWPVSRTLRVLEIGAGTGGSTAHLLPLLAARGLRCEYRFTDVSAHFLNQARLRFVAYEGVDYSLLDIEAEPAAELQQRFDIVIAANVLHATANINRTLQHVHQLMAVDGCLLLLEATTALGWLDLTFGMMPGWWKFTDRDLRPSHPLLTVPTWCDALQRAGFTDAIALQTEPALPHSVIVAQRAANARRWSLPSTPDSDALAAQLMRAGDNVMRHTLLSTPQPVDDLILTLPTTITDALLSQQSIAACSSILQSLQQLANWPQPPRLWLLAQVSSPLHQLAQSTLWGLVQTLQMEYPTLRVTLLQSDDTAALLRELRCVDGETHVRVLDGERRVARLQAILAAQQLVADASQTLDGLRWAPLQRRAPEAGCVEIRVLATGLNFRDVLIALGQYPEAAALGAECCGEIVAVGAGVNDLRIGDRVMAIAADSFASHVVVDARLVAPVPAGVDIVAAATLPVAFATAALSLIDLAQLKAGERVLIHNASGGVGQAAIQIARHIGAEIFATASSEKQAAVRALGIAHVMDSRSADFAATVRALTAGAGVDVVLNALPGELQRASLAALAATGRFVEIGKGSGMSDAEFAAVARAVKFFRVDLSATCRDEPVVAAAQLQRLKSNVEAGYWRALPLQQYATANVVDAFRQMQRARHIGKLVLVDEAAQSVAIAQAKPTLRANRSYLISGGLGALGLLTARWMSQRGAGRLHLVGRRARDDAAIAELRAGGVDVQLHAVDITDRDALATLFDVINGSDKPLGGIVHAAGVLQDKLLAQMSADDLQQVLAPKISGGWNLHELSRGLDLDCFVLYSSATGVLGAPGQANHAAANAFLDALAHYRRGLGLTAQALAWGAWSGVGSALKYQRDGSVSGLPGIGVITPQQGVALLDDIWHSSDASVTVLPVDWNAFLAQPRLRNLHLFDALRYSTQTGDAATTTTPTVDMRARLQQLQPAQRAGALEQHVCAAIAATLGFAPHELDRDAGFFSLGMDSLTALELKNRLQNELAMTLPSTLMFDYPTTTALLGWLHAQFETSVDTGAARQPAARDIPSAEAVDDALPAGDELQQLLDDKLDALDALLGDDEDDFSHG